MWQHALNIFLGLGLALIVFIPTAGQAVNGVFGWTLVFVGVLVAMVAFWGLIDEIHYETEHRERPQEDGM